MKNYLLVFTPLLVLLLTSCSTTRYESTTFTGEYITPPAMEPNADNPLFYESTLPFQAPDFNAIQNEHFRPAFKAGMERHLEEIQAIVENPETPTFENTLVAMERSGELLTRVSSVFYNLASAHTNDTIQEIQLEMAPRLSNHTDNILLDRALFNRVRTLYNSRSTLDLDSEANQLLEETYRDFVRAGALLDNEGQERIRQINERLSTLTTQFQENLLAITAERAVFVEDDSLLDGLGSARISAAENAAMENGYGSGYLVTITNTTRQPILSSLNNRDLRQQIWEASAYRGIGRDSGIDNRPLILEVVELRAERAALLGYDNWASYVLEPQTARTTDAALGMLTDLIPPVVANTMQEAALIEEMMAEDGIDDELRPWDWEYYAEKVRQDKYEINEEEVRPYFELNNVLTNGVFFAMNRLYGVTFEERVDIPVYHPDVRVFDVVEEDGSGIGLFYADYFERGTKRGGAWMNALVSQSGLLNKKPVILNVLNIPKPAAGEPALLSFDNVVTMFHEMGHAMHGLFSNVTWPSLSGTSVPRDFVEFPSTFNEDWAIVPEVIENYAVHHETGEQIPESLLERLTEARTFNQGYDTQEYLGAAVIDMEWHTRAPEEVPASYNSFDQEALEKYGLDFNPVPPRYHSPYFSHIFAGGYSANYYAYIWSEVLAADAFAYMLAGSGLSRENGTRFRNTILSRGGSAEAMDLYLNYRGGEPDVEHLLRRRGLLPENE